MPLVILVLGAGLYFSIRMLFPQFRYLKEMIRNMGQGADSSKGLSPLRAFIFTAARTVGVGNISGMATAIFFGGPGAVFWFWILALIGSAVALIEAILSQTYRQTINGEYRGGPAYYIDQALGKRWLAILFAVLLILCFAFGFNGLQAFNATSSLEYYIPDYATNGAAIACGIVLAVMTAFVIFGGAKRISVITSIIVPIMAVGYIAIAVWTTIANIGELPKVFGMVLASAFDFQAIFGGFAGSVVMLGIKRGLYSNEAGMGSAPNAAATASVSHPCKQGLVQSLSVYIDTLLICTCSAMMVLVFYVQDPEAAAALNGMPLVQMAVNNSVGEMGIHFITFAIFAFAFSSLIGNYFYAESNLRFIKGNSKALLFVFRIVCLGVIFYGAVNSFDLAWNLADIFMGFMAMVNLVAIMLLGKWALKVLDDYTAQRKAGKDPVFVADTIEGLPPTECWHVEELKEYGKPPVKEYLDDQIEVEYAGLN